MPISFRLQEYFMMTTDKQKRRNGALLGILNESVEPLSSIRIAEMLCAGGYDVSERTVRLDLQRMSAEGLIEVDGRRGCRITKLGHEEIGASSAMDRVGLLSSKIDQMTYRMNFDLATRSGQVVVNTTIVEPARLMKSLDDICRVFKAGFAMGRLVGLIRPGERIGDAEIPQGYIGFCTVCSITLNGILLKHGIPARSRFGGLLELRSGQPTRFVEMITYDGTTIDPLVVFIRGGMTDYLGAVRNGNGRIGASFREVPAESRDSVLNLAEKVDAIGLGGFVKIGLKGQPLLNVPVGAGLCGAIVIGGLNPVSVLEERGHHVQSFALSGLYDFGRLFQYDELRRRLLAS
jgi:HTH-type transcriptional regulator, global nitrogen regulator NrpRI